MIRSPIRNTVTIEYPSWCQATTIAMGGFIWIVFNVVFAIYCILSLCYALNGYGHSYCESSSIPLYVLICFFLSYYTKHEEGKFAIFTSTINYNHDTFTERHESKVDLNLPIYQTLINCLLFVWGYNEYYKVSCENNLSHLLIYTIGKIFMVISCIFMVVNAICIFIYRDTLFMTTTITRIDKVSNVATA